jgi:hypothetical protein
MTIIRNMEALDPNRPHLPHMRATKQPYMDRPIEEDMGLGLNIPDSSEGKKKESMASRSTAALNSQRKDGEVSPQTHNLQTLQLRLEANFNSPEIRKQSNRNKLRQTEPVPEIKYATGSRSVRLGKGNNLFSGEPRRNRTSKTKTVDIEDIFNEEIEGESEDFLEVSSFKLSEYSSVQRVSN